MTLRIARSVRDGYAIADIDVRGKESPCPEADAVAAAIAQASYVDWANEDAPLGVAPVLLPGSGWNLAELLAERIIKSEDVRFHLAFEETAGAREKFEARCAELFDVAEQHRLVLVFR